QKDDRQRIVALSDDGLEIETAGARQPHVEHDAAGRVALEARQEVVAAAVGAHLETRRHEQPAHRLAGRLFVVDDVHDRPGRGEGAGGLRRHANTPSGSVNRNVAPPSALLRASIVPRCASSVLRTIASPMPTPSGFVVMNGWNRRLLTSGVRPDPQSATDTSTESPATVLCTVTRRRPDGVAFIASIALRTRVTRTCCSRI